MFGQVKLRRDKIQTQRRDKEVMALLAFYIIGDNILNSFVFVMVVMWKYSWGAHCESIQASQAWRYNGGHLNSTWKGQYHRNQKQTVKFKIKACPSIQRYA